MNIWGNQENLDLLLVNTPLSDYSRPHPEYTPFQPAIGLAVLASYLDRKGFRVGVWDAEADKVSPSRIVEGVATFRSRWLGFNTFASSFEVLTEIVSRIKGNCPETRIMLGGSDVPIGYEYYLNLEPFRGVVIVRNDGELKAEALFEERRPEKIPGVSLASKQGAIIINPEDKEWLVQDINHPDFELNRRFVSYDPTLGHEGPDGKKRAFVASSRGCPYECTFCASSRLVKEGIPPRYRKPENVVRELVGIIQKGILDIKFNDELVWASEGRIKAILGPLKEMGYTRQSGLEIRGNGRADIIARATEETLDLMSEVGVRKVGVGVEQGTAEGMRGIKKRTTPEEVMIATRRLSERGISVLANFMFGIPGQDERETKAVVALARELVLIGRQHGVEVELDGYKYRPYQGTELWDELIRGGYRPEDLRKVIQISGVDTGSGSHLQVEPFLNLGNLDIETEWEHRRVLDNLTKMTDKELAKLERQYPLSLCLEGQYSGSPERK